MNLKAASLTLILMLATLLVAMRNVSPPACCLNQCGHHAEQTAAPQAVQHCPHCMLSSGLRTQDASGLADPTGLLEKIVSSTLEKAIQPVFALFRPPIASL